MFKLAIQLYSHLKAWAKCGFKTVSFYQYANRRLICDFCDKENNKKRCPKCGCFLVFYCRLKSSECWNWDNTIDVSLKIESDVPIKSENKCLRN